MTFSYVILILSAAGFVALVVRGWKRRNIYTSIPALVWFVLTIAIYAAHIIDAQDNVVNAALYNDLSNGLRLYSIFVFLVYAWLLK